MAEEFLDRADNPGRARANPAQIQRMRSRSLGPSGERGWRASGGFWVIDFRFQRMTANEARLFLLAINSEAKKTRKGRRIGRDLFFANSSRHFWLHGFQIQRFGSLQTIQSATESLRLMLNRDHPADPEPIFQHAEFRGPEGLRQRHLDFATFCQGIEGALGRSLPIVLCPKRLRPSQSTTAR